MINKIMITDHLPATELNTAILQSGMVICRSGYTTIMDLVKLQQKAILIPTPSQTEQEYLAGYLAEKNIFFSVPQNDFSLSTALQKTKDFLFASFSFEPHQYKKLIADLTDKR